MAQTDRHNLVLGNRLLAALPTDELARLAPRVELVQLESRQVLHRAHTLIRAAYFLTSGMVSVVARLERGGAIEVGVIGREGVVGLPLALGVDSSPNEVLVQVPSAALRIGADAFRDALARCPTLHQLVLRYECAFHAQVAQTAACNGRHPLQRRLARWLLMARDRVIADDLPLSQELMATMLGVRRAGVTEAVGALQRIGAICLSKGSLKVLDHRNLERASCECYAANRQAYEQLLPASEQQLPPDAGDERAAIIYTIAETAKLNGLDPEAYIASVLSYGRNWVTA